MLFILGLLVFLLHVTNVTLLFTTQCYLGFGMLVEKVRLSRELTAESTGDTTRRHRVRPEGSREGIATNNRA